MERMTMMRIMLMGYVDKAVRRKREMISVRVLTEKVK